MFEEKALLKINRPRTAQRFVGLVNLLIGGVCLYLIVTKLAPNFIPKPSKRVGEFVILCLFLSFALFVCRVGLGEIFGEFGGYVSYRVGEIVFWRRNLLFTVSIVRKRPDQVRTIQVKKWSNPGVFTHGRFYVVTLSGEGWTKKVADFGHEKDAIELAEKLATYCNLPVN